MRVILFKIREGGRRRSSKEYRNNPIGPGYLISYRMVPPGGFYHALELRPLGGPALPPLAVLFEPELMGIGHDRMRFRGFEASSPGEEARALLQEWICELSPPKAVDPVDKAR